MIPNLTILRNEIRKPIFDFEEHVQFIQANLEITYPEYYSVGIDPGSRHWGLSILTPQQECLLFELEFVRGKDTNTRLYQLHQWLKGFNYLQSQEHSLKVVVEGASYADRYRQVELQDIRAGAVFWYSKTEIVPPNTIRKIVFGSGKIKNPWKEIGIPDNAAAALACGLYAVLCH